MTDSTDEPDRHRATIRATVRHSARRPETVSSGIAGQGKDGFYVVDVFKSQEAVDRFNEAMRTIPRQVGIEEPPDFFPAHTVVGVKRGS